MYSILVLPLFGRDLFLYKHFLSIYLMAKSDKSNIAPQSQILLGPDDQILENFDLIKVQKDSWETFLNKDLKDTLNEFFPIDDYTGKKFTLYFDDIYFGEPRYSIELCQQKKLTYDVPIYLSLRLLNKKTGTEKKQDVYFFNLPKMTSRGTFIINGIERAVISQISRSPGVYFTAEVDKTTGLTLYNAEIRPYIGAWIDITINKNNLIEMKVNKKRKFLATAFIRSFQGHNNAQILSQFNDVSKTVVDKYIAQPLKKTTPKTRMKQFLRSTER